MQLMIPVSLLSTFLKITKWTFKFGEASPTEQSARLPQRRQAQSAGAERMHFTAPHSLQWPSR